MEAKMKTVSKSSMGSEPVIEVSTEYDKPFKDRRVCVVYRNGKEIAAFVSFERAMKFAYPCWQPDSNGHEAQLDNC